MKGTYFVLDFETTGLSHETERVIEVGAAKVVNGQVVETLQSLINPKRRISSQITGITGITNHMVSKAPYAEDVFPVLFKFLNVSLSPTPSSSLSSSSHSAMAPIIAHNASFDSRFFQAELNRCRLKSPNPFLCTVLLSRRVFPELSSHKLESVCAHLAIKNKNAHRALADVMMTVDVFKGICAKVKKIINHDQIEYKILNELSAVPKSKVISFLKKHEK